MKKNISINISGIIFHIEEDGYETLRKYLDSVNRYFSTFEDSSEILADIESRIAEIFLAKLNEGKQVITAEDVSSLIATMGNVNDFKAAEETEFAGGGEPNQKEKQREQQQSYSGAPSPNKKLFRDQKRKILGGVCAGLAHYFNVDPVWTRVILALLALGYGGGILLYIILWIALPGSEELDDQPAIKKMYRNPDQKVLGGVASGIASFFGADIALIRLLFVITAFFGGAGFILYIILWISLPEAKTITEKMEMQGEPVTLSNIESTVKKGINEKDQPEESTLAKIILFPFRALAAVLNAIAQFLGPVFKVLIEVLRVAIGIIITIIGLAFLFAIVFSGGVALGIFSASTPLWGDVYFSGLSLPVEAMRRAFPMWSIIVAFMAGFIPSVFILLIGSSIIAKRVIFRPMVGWTLFVLFFVSIVFLSFSIPQFVYSFKEEGEYKEESSYTVSNNLVLSPKEVGLDDYDVTDLILIGYEGKEVKLVKRFESQGSTRKIASENAQMVTHNVEQKNDSILIFDSNIGFKDKAIFRAQRLQMELFIPYHKKFKIEREMWRLINNYGKGKYRYNGSRYWNYYNSDDQYWEMTEDGLSCITCDQPEKITSDFFNPEDEKTESGSAVLGIRDQFGFRDFTRLDLNGLFVTRITKGNEFSVRLDGKESLKSRYEVYLDGETLVIEYSDKQEFFWKNKLFDEDDMLITIVMPTLEKVSMRGAGKATISGFREDEMDIKLVGAIEADGNFRADNLGIDLTGASFLELIGEGNFIEANLTGASGLRAYGFEVERAFIEAHGASTAKVNVTETLETVSGLASQIRYRGNPTVIDRD